jgi:hypothetical protein
MTLSTREITVADREAVKALWAQAKLSSQTLCWRDVPPLSDSGFAAYHAVPTRRALLLMENGSPAGFILMAGKKIPRAVQFYTPDDARFVVLALAAFKHLQRDGIARMEAEILASDTAWLRRIKLLDAQLTALGMKNGQVNSYRVVMDVNRTVALLEAQQGTDGNPDVQPRA